MKKLLLFTIAIMTYCMSIGQVTLPHYQGFDYTEGDRLIASGTTSGIGGWITIGTPAASSDPLIESSPNWRTNTGLPSFSGNALQFKGGSDDPYLPFAQITSGKVYASFIFKIKPLEEQHIDFTNAGDYFFAFVRATVTNNYASTVYVRKDPTLGISKFNIGVGETNTIARVAWGSTAFDIGDEIVIVISYDLDYVGSTNNGISHMWINPVISGTTEPAPTLSTTTDETTGHRADIGYLRINKNSNALTPNLIMDELRVGTTWASVVTNPTAGIGKDDITGFSLYPNPVKGGKVFINSANNYAERTIVVFDVLGKQVVSQKGAQNSVDVSHLNKGIYIMKVEEEGKVATRKLVIE